METRASHVLIGAFALGVLLLAFGFVLWLGKLELDREWTEYEIVFKEAVTGLTVGGAVQYNGIQIGDVRRLSLDRDDPSRVIARVRIAGETPVMADTRAKLTLTGLTGVAIIQLSGGTAEAGRLTAPEGELPRIIADESALAKLLANSEGIVTSVNEMMLRLSVLLNDENLGKIAATIAHVEQVTGEMAAHRADIGGTLADIRTASAQLKTTLERTEALMVRLDGLADSSQRVLDDEARALLASARQSLDSARRFTDSAYATVEENRDAVQSFANQGMAQVGPAVAELRATLRKLEQIAERLNEDPAAYLLGADQPKEYDAR
jgi:phospholipid/cholesterol/gamma-HCH transport system substrate-binding protein